MPLVIFIDMDYFFAACEELRRPELKGKPFIVGTSPEESKMKGVVQTCNYEARAFGVRSGMATSEAYRKKKELVYVEADDPYYEELSRRVLQLLRSYQLPIEGYSIDEFAIDATQLGYERAFDTAKAMKARVNTEIGLPCTMGVSMGKTFAKMACDEAKPNGAKLLREEEIPGFLRGKGVRKLPGIGPKTEERLKALGITTLDELARADVNRLIAELGSNGSWLHNLALGKDSAKVMDAQEVLSISRERTLDEQTRDPKRLDLEIERIADMVIEEVRKSQYSFKTVTSKARYADFTERIRSRTLQNYSSSGEVLKATAKQLARELIGDRPIRKVGVRVSTLISAKGQQRLV